MIALNPAADREAAPPPLETATLRWSPVLGRDERPIGFRLAIDAAASEPLAALLDALLAGFGDGSAGLPHALVLLAPRLRAADESLAAWGAPRNVLLELDARALAAADCGARLAAAQRRGLRLALRVTDAGWPPAERLAAFQYVVGPAAAGRRPSAIAWLATGADTRAAMQSALAAGASGVVGGPLEAPAGGELRPQQRALLNLIRLVQSDADCADLEREFKRDPLLAYMLLTLANSPAFMRAQPIASLGHAIQMLGYQRLVKWLVLLLVIASKEARALPAIYRAVLRGLLLENCAAAAGAAPTVRDECFVVGAFSLLDRITGLALPQLISQVPLPAAVGAALSGDGGPYSGWLALACALEDDGGDADRARLAALAAAHGLGCGAINAALLRALAANDALQTLV